MAAPPAPEREHGSWLWPIGLWMKENNGKMPLSWAVKRLGLAYGVLMDISGGPGCIEVPSGGAKTGLRRAELADALPGPQPHGSQPRPPMPGAANDEVDPQLDEQLDQLMTWPKVQILDSPTELEESDDEMKRKLCEQPLLPEEPDDQVPSPTKKNKSKLCEEEPDRASSPTKNQLWYEKEEPPDPVYDFYGRRYKEEIEEPPKTKMYRVGTLTVIGQRMNQGLRILKVLKDDATGESGGATGSS